VSPDLVWANTSGFTKKDGSDILLQDYENEFEVINN